MMPSRYLLVVLGFADPAAAVIGRRFGQVRLINGRSLEGTATFFVTAWVTGMAALAVFHPEIPRAGVMCLGAAVTGAIAELVSRRVDDNFTIPMSVALVAAAIAHWGV